MMRRLAVAALAASCFTAGAFAQEPRDDVLITLPAWVGFTHYDCPPGDTATPGGTPDHPVELEFFGQAWANAAYSDDPDLGGIPHEFECRWIRQSGFVGWLDYYDYRGILLENALASYQDGAVRYIIESLAPDSPPRSDLARRHVTIVGRFYDLCAAAERAEKASGETWRLFGPCHYGDDQGMMLADVRVEKIHDAAPQYIVGESNRPVMGSLVTATAVEQSEVEPVVRAWAASLQKGLRAFADATTAQYPKQDEESRKSTYDFIEDADSYASYLLNRRNFSRVNLASAQIAIFRPADEDNEFRNAVGCICLESSCADRWPLTEADADNFLGPAACVALTRWDGKTWNW